MSTEPEFMADALDDLADAEASLEADETLEAIELAQLNFALDYLRDNAPSLAEFEARFGKINAAHLPQPGYQVDPDSPSAKAARRMRKAEGL